jgi:hypothetical protein
MNRLLPPLFLAFVCASCRSSSPAAVTLCVTRLGLAQVERFDPNVEATGMVVVEVMDVRKQPIPGVIVELIPEGSAGVVAEVTHADGRARFEAVRAGHRRNLEIRLHYREQLIVVFSGVLSNAPLETHVRVTLRECKKAS